MAKVENIPEGLGPDGIFAADPVSWARERIEGNVSLAQKHKCKHRYEKAIGYYGKALNLLPPSDLSLAKKSEISRQVIECLCERGEYASALDELETARKQIVPEVSAVSVELGKLHTLASHIHTQLGSYEDAHRECRRAIETFEARGADREASKAYKYLGQVQLLTGDVSSAYNSFTQSLAAFERTGDGAEKASVLNRMAHLYFITAEWERCVDLLEEARELAEKHELFRLVGATSANLATIHLVLGNWDMSLRYNESSLNIFTVLGDNLAITRRYICQGNLSQVKREWRDAQEAYEKARDLASEKHYRRELALAYEFIGELAFDRDNVEGAESSYITALKIAREIAPGGDLINEIYRRFAEVRIAQGEGRKALSLCQKSWDISLRLGDRFEEGVVFRVFGLAYSLLGERDRARDYFSQGIDSLRSIGEKYERAKTLLAAGRFISRSYEDNGSRMEALRYLSQARDIVHELKLEYLLGVVELELERVRQLTLT